MLKLEITLPLSALLACGCAREPEPPRGVVLVLLDTLRADHLGCYGYETRPTSDPPFADLPELRLYKLSSDPTEERNLADKQAALARTFLEQLERELGGTGIDPETLEVSPELEAQLRALGYGD